MRFVRHNGTAIRILIFLAALAGMAGVALWLHYRRGPQPAPVRKAGTAIIAAPEGTFSGKIGPQHVTRVSASADGNIEAFLVDVGQEVFAGQLLARVGAEPLEKSPAAAAHALEQAQEEASQAETIFNMMASEASRADADAQRARQALDGADAAFSRQKTLFAAAATPRLTYERVEREYEAALAEFTVLDKAAHAVHEQAQSALDQVAKVRKAVAEQSRQLEDAQDAVQVSEVHSPVDGLVVGRNGEVGKPAAEAGGDLFEIATDIYALEVTIEPPATVLQRIRPGQPALVLILGIGNASMPGEVKRIDGSQVVVEFTNNSPAIRPGMQAEVQLKLD